MTTSARWVVTGLLTAGGTWSAGLASADVIHLVNGAAIEVEAWRDVGDAVEFARGGGIIRISKAEIRRIDGKSQSHDLRMRSAPPGAAASTSAGDRATAAKEMLDLLKQGEGLIGQAVLSAVEKAGALRRLSEKWRGLDVPDALREPHAKGQQGLQMATEAYVAEDEGTAPNVKERIDQAKAAIQEAQEELKKSAGEQG